MTAASRIAVATSALRRAEQSAASTKPADNRSGGSLYTGSGRSNKDDKKGKNKKKLKSRIALIVLLAGLGGGTIFLGSSHSLLAPALQTLVTEATDTQYASGSMRAIRILKYALKGEGKSWDGGKAYSEVPDNFKSRLSKNNIEVDGQSLIYTDVAADGTATVKNIDADDLVNAYKTDVDFRDSYTTARRGRVASFFDKAANNVYRFLGITRNDYVDYKQTGDADADMTRYKETLSSRFEGDTTSTRRTTIEEEPEYDEDGNEIGKKPGANSEEASGRVSTDTTDATTNARSIINSLSSKVSQLNDVVNVGCGMLAIGSMVSTLIAVNEVYQSINYFLNNSENPSKMMAGYGDKSAINPFLNFITSPATTSVENFGDGQVGVIGGSIDQGDLELGFTGDKVTLDGSFVEGNAAQMVLANAPGSSLTTDLFSFERAGNSIARVLGTLTGGVTSYKACSIAKIGANALSIAVTLSPAGIVAITSNIVLSCLKGVLVSVTASVLLGFLVPILAEKLTNPVTYLVGEAASAQYFRGAAVANSRLGQSGSGQGALSKEAAAAYSQLNQEVLALDAELDRKNHSPFDITNHNTFLGNIAYRFLLPFTTSSSVTTNTSNFLRTTSTSLASILSPNTYAASSSSYTYGAYYGKCETLESIDAAGDIFCAEKRGTDVNTMDITPDDEEYKNIISPNLDCNNEGVCTIIPNSDLDFYQQDCAGRTSPLGIVDQNILSRHVASGKIQMLSEKLGTILQGLPLIGDLLDALDGLKTIIDDKTLMWANGQICVNSSENKYWNSEMRYYERYMEDMRVISQMHNDDSKSTNSPAEENQEEATFASPILANYERYTSENPITSYADYLSRISGLTKENVETVLAVVDYYNYIGLYDPDTRVALDEHELTNTSSADLIANFKHEDLRFLDDSPVQNSSEPVIASREYIIYADLRSRNYVA